VTIHLSVLLFWPLALGLVAGLLPRGLAGAMGLGGAIVPLAYAIVILLDFEPGRAGLQFVTNDTWIEDLGIRYQLGIDGLNLWLVALTTLLFAVAALWLMLRPPATRPRLFTFHMALAETAVLGAFLAQDMILFVLFFDLMLVPFYFLVGQWGTGPDRVAATFKLVVYTLVGSLLMLAAAVATGVLADAGPGGAVSFSFAALARNPVSEGTQEWLFAAFALAFLIKMPAFPFHGWMPDGYRNMPLPVLVVFSGVLSKVAAYGFLRVVLPLFPAASADFQEIVLLIALASVLYGSAQAFTQTNARLILGYSSMAQLGFITLGIFALDSASRGGQGAVLQMVNHGLVVAPLFFVVALLAERAGGSDDIREMGGMAFRAPVLAALFLIAALANLAMPGSSNFVGEFFILLGLFGTKIVYSIVAFTGVAMASVYMLRMFIRTMHNRLAPGAESRDLTLGDAAVIAPLVLCILALSLYPQQAMTDSQRTVKAALAKSQRAAGNPSTIASVGRASP
jgi:NADH-quinone oxidoreductase subunit M